MMGSRAREATDDNMVHAHLPKATNTHSEYVIYIYIYIYIALSRQKWLHERASMLGYSYIACHVFF